MQTDNIKDICSGLMNKAASEKFLEHTVDDVEEEANKFVEEFAEENGLVHWQECHHFFCQHSRQTSSNSKSAQD